MRIARLLVIGTIAVGMLLLTRPASAQLADFYSSPGYTSYINQLTNNYIWNSSMARYTGGNNTAGSRGSRSTSSSGQSSRAEVPAYRQYPAVRFKSTGTRLTLQEYLDSVKVSPADKAELKELVLGIFKKYEAEAAAKGYPDDWALAFVSYVGLNLHVYHGRTEKPLLPFEQNIGLRDVVAEYATDHGIFKNVTDREKQELYELLVMVGGLTYHFYEKAQTAKNARDISDSKAMAAQNLKMIGIKP